MNINKNKENKDKLIKLITENPDLSVIPFYETYKYLVKKEII